jgi:protocatechuate 3,4-dioxygenase beta subunit
MRIHLGLAAAAIAVTVLGGCDTGRSDPAPGAGSDPTATDDAVATGPGESEPSATPGQRCSEATDVAATEDATVTFGPINGVEETTADGEPLVVVGTVYSEECDPLPGASLIMYQTDGAGEYGPGHGTDDMRCCHLGGTVVTDTQGRFQVNTVRPAHYRGEANPPPAHIHLEARHPDAQTLNSEIVFADDEALPVNAEDLGLVVTNPTRTSAGWHAVAEIVMTGTSE